ncbi:hypothetical protein C7P35_08910 [Salmonella enterica]|uniref:Conjugal transfer protein TraE n=2 Tax=Enterobacterales TaxID=91347 RepID=A0AAX2BHD4_CITAM|nr:hypothetical protein [Salmonella enterica subsp. enterica serovar Infantis]EAB4350059.1 hypothetical protein [Salmonella enterica]EAF5631359.1 hypothetical protein [Salmonella enterica subsp. enterica serovar Senftenberg]OQD47407.1 hypothetical protein BWZ29_20220 [Enterobacter cancerogenus]SAZ40358.1 conserved protein of unknown function [Citrobacter amalonaticus]STH93754.1 protein TraE [Citrobacter braakii]
MFRFTQLLQSLIKTGNMVAEDRISQLEDTSVKELTTVRLRPETKAYLQSQSETLGVSLSQVINMILDGVVSMEMKPAADNKIKGIYDRIMSLFELHNINTVDMAKMLSGYGIKLSHLRNPDKFIDILSMDMIKEIADWFSINYKWIIGETNELYSPRDNTWYKDSYGFSLLLLEKSFRHSDLKVSVVKANNVSFENAEKLEEQYSRLYVGFILSYTSTINGVSFTKYEVCEFQRWNYDKCRGYLKFIFYFLDSVRSKINCQGVSFNEEIVDGLMAGRLFPSTIKGMLSETWFIADRIGHIESNYDVEINPVEYLNRFNRLIRLLRFGSSVTILDIEYTTKDFSYGWIIKYSCNGEFHTEFYHSLATGLDDIYDKFFVENPS